MGVTSPPVHRLISKVTVTEDGCWRIRTSGQRYANFWLDGRSALAHRASYRLFVGEIPEGFHIDHLCKVTQCVNPAHLEAVTAKENTARSNATAGINARKTHCKRGHAFVPENTYITPKGERQCRECLRQKARRFRNEGKAAPPNKARRAAYMREWRRGRPLH